MNTGKALFAQLMDFLPWTTFTRIVDRYGGDHRVRTLSCAEQYRSMAFAQLTYRESLRDIETCLSVHASKLYHMGFRQPVRRSTLADANERRDWRIHAALAQRLITQARTLYVDEELGLDLTNTVYALDSTTIALCLSVFPWAHFRTTKAAVKMHTLLDLRGNIPSFIHISDGKLHDVHALDMLLPEAGAIYVVRPFGAAEVAAMSAATSPGTGLAYGLQRVCAAWGFARSSFYAMKSRQQATAERPPAKRRGPKPSISDEALLVAIEADLEASPWEGEGHRKVWARLRVCRGIRVSRKRVLRVMRENNLLSPHRCRRRGGNPHVGEIITHAPNLMWGTDGVRVFTVDDGWGWIFTAIEHWNAECVGWHVCKRGDRFAALQPISMGLARLYASTSAGAARGLALRMDHGSQYLSDHFTNQIKFWGIQPSYAFVEQPQTNGVAERFNRTLKEQIIRGRIYRNIAELRNAVRGFVEQYNAQWIVEKNGYLSPAQARQAWHTAMSLRPAA